MSSQNSHSSIPTWRFISPETFELTLRRLMEPSAEAKMQAALAEVILQMESAESGPMSEERARFREAEKLRKKREKLERRLQKLRTLKNMAVGPLLFGLVFGGIIWLVILISAGVGGYVGVSSIEAAIAEDMKNIEENQGTALTIEELNEDLHEGQVMGVAPLDSNGGYDEYEDGNYPDPLYLLEVTNWEAELDGCDETLADFKTPGELPGCIAAARIDFAKQDQPEVTQTCLYLQLAPGDGSTPKLSADEQLEWGRATSLITEQEAVLGPLSHTAGEEDSWNPSTLAWCQAFGTDDEQLRGEMSSIAGQVAYRINSQAYFAGGIFTWLESDGSYAPRSVWEGRKPSSSEEY